MMRRRIGPSVVVALLVGCTGYDDGTQALEALDVDAYSESVQPYVGVRCASLDCHGDPGRPLRLYARNGLRLSAELRGEPVSADEVARNVEMFAGTDPGEAVDESWLVLKPLSTEAGGVHHEGRAVWESREAPGYICLADWLSKLPGASLQEPCSEALAPWQQSPSDDGL